MTHELRSLILRDADDLHRVAAGSLTLARGARGEAVGAVQDGLLALGYGLLGGADGAFGRSTEAALRGFRELHGRHAAAVVDAPTLALLDASLVRAEGVAGYILKNQRFCGDGRLAQLLTAGRRWPLPRRGESVARVQRALLDLLFALPRWGVDGVLGDETHEAIRQFQRWQRIRPGGELTPLTLMALDQVAPAPGRRVIRAPEYERLIRDGVLTVTVAIGYDADGNDLREFAALQTGLRREGFVPAAPAIAGDVLTYTCPLLIAGQTGTMRLRLVGRRTDDAEDRLADGLVQDAVCIYAGHARYDVASGDERFAIAVGAPRPGDDDGDEVLAGVPDERWTGRVDPQRYQLWAFAGCTTRHYPDELRRLTRAKRADNLDLIVSTRPIYWVDSASYPLEIVRGLLRGRSVQEITTALSAQAQATERIFGVVQSGSAFFADGFGDNAPGWRA